MDDFYERLDDISKIPPPEPIKVTATSIINKNIDNIRNQNSNFITTLFNTSQTPKLQPVKPVPLRTKNSQFIQSGIDMSQYQKVLYGEGPRTRSQNKK
jgi:hypothetical protein